MKDKRTYTFKKEHGEDLTHENEFKVDLSRKIDEFQETIKGYIMLVEEQKKEIWQLKQTASENEKNKNLLQGYKKVIHDLSDKLRQKDS